MSKLSGDDVIIALSLIDRLLSMVGNIGARVRERIATNGPKITEEELDAKGQEVREAISQARAEIKAAREADGG